MKKILVPVNFSPASRHAAEYAVRLAAATGSTVELLHVYLDPIPATVGAEPWTVVVSDVREQKEVRMHEETGFLSNRYGVDLEGTTQAGFKVHSIRKFARKKEVDLLITGFKMGGKISNTVLKMIRRVHKPVLIVPEEAPLVAVKRIALAIDFNYPPGQECFDPLSEMINAFDASLSVVHVEAKDEDSSQEDAPAKADIGQILSRFSYVYDKLENDDTGSALLKYVQDHSIDLLVMIAHHNAGAWEYSGSLLIGSVIRKTPIPVLILADGNF